MKTKLRMKNEDYIVPRVANIHIRKRYKNWSLYKQFIFERNEDKYHRVWNNYDTTK